MVRDTFSVAATDTHIRQVLSQYLKLFMNNRPDIKHTWPSPRPNGHKYKSWHTVYWRYLYIL